MRRASRIDDNQPAIVKALRDAGCTVESLAAVGKGVPDLLVGVKVVRDPLIELLRELEWGRDHWHERNNYITEQCPVCFGLRAYDVIGADRCCHKAPHHIGHTPDCRLDAALQQADEPTAINLLFEVKDGAKPPSARKLTPAQQTWHVAWAGRVRVVKSPEDALAVIKEVTGA